MANENLNGQPEQPDALKPTPLEAFARNRSTPAVLGRYAREMSEARDLGYSWGDSFMAPIRQARHRKQVLRELDRKQRIEEGIVEARQQMAETQVVVDAGKVMAEEHARIMGGESAQDGNEGATKKLGPTKEYVPQPPSTADKPSPPN